MHAMNSGFRTKSPVRDPRDGSHSFPPMVEPVSKEEWRQYFQAKLKAAEQGAISAPTEREREQLQAEAGQIRRKLALLDFDLDAWKWACEQSDC
jgi:hypothetical protein